MPSVAAATTPPESSAARDAALAELVEGYLSRLQAGEAIDPGVFAAEHPEHAERLARLLPALELMDDLRRSSIHPGSGLSLTPVLMETPGVTPGLLGDFQILREVGRGGMGVVYEARQISLDRRVALKVLPMAAAMDPRQLQRFQLEAKAAACLHHTNIVPVHAVGSERGVHYYAMQFIEGQTLAAIIGELSRNPPREGEPPCEPESKGARTEPRPPGTEQGDLASRLASGELAPAEPAPPGAVRSSGTGFQPVSVADEDKVPAPPGAAPPSGTGFQPVSASSPVERPAPRPATGKSPSSPLSSTATRSRAFFRTVADLGIQAAEAIEHAHGLGVVHRDIKPANILIDERGTLWITDFGLARLRNDTGLTMTGDLMGTLRYMSPEQAMGRAVDIDHRTDIYSLAVTLYELLTGKPAITGQDRQEVLRRIAHEEPTPPRRLEPAIPRELETIVLKAMSKEPASRYATAQELADDLRRFLEHKTIKAKRPTVLERAAKWSRRHRTTVVAAMLILTLATAGLGASTVLIARERAKATRQRDRARQAVDEMYTEIARKWLSQQPELVPLQREFLLKALAFYQEFAREEGNDPGARHLAARAERNAGDIHLKLGEHSRAESTYRRAVQIEEMLVAAFPNVADYQQELANAYASLALQLGNTGRSAEAQRTTGRALEIRKALVVEFPDIPDYRRELALSYNLHGSEFRKRGRFVEAEESVRRAIELLEALAAKFPEVRGYRQDLGDLYSHLGILYQQMGHASKAERAWHRAISLKEALQAGFPEVLKNPRYRDSLALDHTNLGVALLGAPDRFMESERAFRRALELLEVLVAEFPGFPDYRNHLAMSYSDLGILLYGASRLAEAEQATHRAVEIYELLVARAPDVTDFQSSLAASLDTLGRIRNGRGELAAALSSFQSAIEHQRAALGANPNNPTFRQYLRNHYLGAADVSERQGNHAGAAAAAEQSARVSPHRARDAVSCAGYLIRCQRLAETDPRLSLADRQARIRDYANRVAMLLRAGAEAAGDDPEELNALAWFLATYPAARLRDPARAVELARKAVDKAPKAGAIWNTLGVACCRAGKWEEAIEALSRSMGLTSGGSAADWFFLAMAHWHMGDKDKARSWYDKAVAWMKQDKSQDEDLSRFRAEAAALLGMNDDPKPTGKKEDTLPQPSKP